MLHEMYPQPVAPLTEAQVSNPQHSLITRLCREREFLSTRLEQVDRLVKLLEKDPDTAELVDLLRVVS